MESITPASPKRHKRIVLIVIGAGLVGAAIGLGIGYLSWYNVTYYKNGVPWAGECNIAGINVHGELWTYVPSGGYSEPDQFGNQVVTDDVTSSEDIVTQIESAADDPAIAGIMVEIDSGGGEPVAGEEIANALKAAGKPSVALIRQSGMSGAYWAATGADYIVASQNSDVGSIGVTMSYVYENDPNSQYVQLSVGKYKDSGNPDKPLTTDDRAIITRDLNIIHQNFIDAVAENRGLPREKVSAIADGSSVLGRQAEELGLIDEIGSWTEAKSYLSSRIGADASVCW